MEETLEEAAERINSKTGIYNDITNELVMMAKWVQQRSYTEDEVKYLLQKRLLSVGITSPEEATDIWFKQYKKTNGNK